ncbi:MAG: efflux RND transporter permease subunit [Deltaproteobacteria bacterium]|nr:efflux RND transporter permease subunit [Deltaproteobacteria bacterium]
MKLSELSIRKPVFAWVLMFGLLFFGALGFSGMGVSENPDVDYPTVRVRYSYEGATPEVVEKDVLEPVEGFLVSIDGIRNLTSEATRNQGELTVEFELEKDVDVAVQEIQTLLGRAQRDLPERVESPIITKNSAGDSRILTLGIQSDLPTRELMILFRDRIRDRLSTVRGVAEIQAYGFHEPQMRIDLDAAKLNQYQLTTEDIVASIQREHQELPAGKFELGEKEDLIRIMGEARTVKDFQNIIISQRGGQPNYRDLRLKDVATIYEGVENTRRISRLNGVPNLAMAIYNQRGENAVAVANRAKERLKEINKELPKGTQVKIIYDQSYFINANVEELVRTLIFSAIFTSIVCWIFLGSFSATVNVLLAIPVAIVGTFALIKPLNFTLNTFTLLGLALAIGIVVDDAIIMLENIARYMQKGYDRVSASFKGSREISFAVVATTLALVAVFIPIVFMGGIEGKFFLEFAITLGIAVSLSSIEALTLAPMRCSQFLKIGERRSFLGRNFEKIMDVLKNFYEKILRFVLNYRLLVVSLSFLLVGGSFYFVLKIPTEFTPNQDRSVLFLSFLAPEGKSLEYTDQKIKEFEKIMAAHPAIDRYVVAVGGFGEGGQGNQGNGVAILKNFEDRKESHTEVAADLRKSAAAIQGIQIFIRDNFGTSLGGRRGSPIEFTINGPDPQKQKELYYQMEKAMNATKLLVGVRSDDVRTLPELRIVPDREAAIDRGVSISQINEVINIAFGGVVAGFYSGDNSRYDVFVQLQEKDRKSKEDLKPLYVRNNRGELINLLKVVKTQPYDGPQTVYRENRIRGVRVDASLEKGATQGEAIKAINEIAKRLLPKGYYLNYSFTPAEKLQEAMIIMILGLIVAYMVMAVQFNSFSDPFIIFMSIPFGLVGAMVALLLGGQSLNIYSAIGMLLTMGLVKKNAILLVEFTNQVRDQGVELKEALIKACPIRLRPILMTTLSTLAGALPAALIAGAGSETRIPMALTIIGGVSVSVFFTLFVVPAVFSLLNPKRRSIPQESPDLFEGEVKI